MDSTGIEQPPKPATPATPANRLNRRAFLRLGAKVNYFLSWHQIDIIRAC